MLLATLSWTPKCSASSTMRCVDTEMFSQLHNAVPLQVVVAHRGNLTHGEQSSSSRHVKASDSPVDQRQLLLPVDDNYSCRSWEVTIWYRRYRIGHRSAGNDTEAEANGRQGTTSGGGGIWYERADGTDVAARQVAVGEGGQAEVANPTGPVRRGMGRGGRAPSAERR